MSPELNADEAAREAALALQTEARTADLATIELLFTAARTHYGWLAKPVEEATLKRLYDIAKMGPTSMNQQPMRIVFVRSGAGKARLKPCLMEANIAKMMAAPVTAIIAHDLNFFDLLPKTFPPNPNARDIFANNGTAASVNAFRNGTLQGAYVMLAARAVGLDVGAMSGFDNARLDEEFFHGTSLRSNFLVNLGYADTSKIFRRLPRLAFNEVCEFA